MLFLLQDSAGESNQDAWESVIVTVEEAGMVQAEESA